MPRTPRIYLWPQGSNSRIYEGYGAQTSSRGQYHSHRMSEPWLRSRSLWHPSLLLQSMQAFKRHCSWAPLWLPTRDFSWAESSKAEFVKRRAASKPESSCSVMPSWFTSRRTSTVVARFTASVSWWSIFRFIWTSLMLTSFDGAFGITVIFLWVPSYYNTTRIVDIHHIGKNLRACLSEMFLQEIL